MSEQAILDADHRVTPCADLYEWARWMELPESRRVALTELANGRRVSTVFLGLDHGFDGAPLWFETMIFPSDNDEYQVRYATWDEAKAGHTEACRVAAEMPRAVAK